jgi:hypothetical protein
MNNSAVIEKELQLFIDSLPSLEEAELPEIMEEAPAPEEAPPHGDKSDSCSPPLLDELINYMKGRLAAMKSFALLSQDAFKDAELGQHYYETVSEDVEKTTAMLDCYRNYLRFNNPTQKKDTIQTLIEEILKDNGRRLKAKSITIINKQFEKDLPETTMPDAQLRYVLDTVIQYSFLSLPHYSSLGFLTRQYDHSEGNGHEHNGLQKESQCVEILVVSSRREKPKGSPAGVPTGNNGTGADLMLELVKEVIRKNHGAMRVKSYDQKAMTFVSLILPVDRRKVVRFPSLKPSKESYSDERNQIG